MTIKAVVWDIGNVLIKWNPERVYDRHIGAEQRRALMAEVDLHSMNLEVDRGADLHRSVEALAAQHPKWADAIRLWRDDWLAMASPDIPASAQVLRDLRAQGVQCFALSNFGITTFEIAEAAYPVLAEFDQRWISGYMGVIKPDSAIYERLETESGLTGAELLFTDDRPENIEAAAARGWHTHLFEGPQGWADCLRHHGLLEMSDVTAP